MTRKFSTPTLALLESHRRLVAAENAAYDAAKALACSATEDITASFECAAVARDYATACRSRYSQLRGVAL